MLPRNYLSPQDPAIVGVTVERRFSVSLNMSGHPLTDHPLHEVQSSPSLLTPLISHRWSIPLAIYRVLFLKFRKLDLCQCRPRPLALGWLRLLIFRRSTILIFKKPASACASFGAMHNNP